MPSRQKKHGGHKSNMAKRRQRERFKARHPEGRKAYAKAKRRVKHLKRLAKKKKWAVA